MKRITPVFLLIACITLMVASTASTAFAGSTVEIRQKDGTRWRGEVNDTVRIVFARGGRSATIEGQLIRGEERYLQVLAADGQKTTIFISDIVSIKTTGAGDPANNVETALDNTDEPGSDNEMTEKPAMVNVKNRAAQPDAYASRKPGVFVLPMRGGVGVEFRAEEVRKLVEEVDKYGPGQIIIFEVDSPGGLVTEGEKLERLLSEVRKRHRLIAWIEEAISGGCAFSICCPEIYFRTEGTAGSVTMFSGTKAATGAELEAWLRKLGDWMEGGGRSRYIAEAMIHAPLMLSYDKNDVTGEVTFYNDLSGEFILSRPGENLTFNSSNAYHCGFADGIADTYEELAKLLDLPEWHEKSNVGREIADEWKSIVERCEHELPRLIAEYQNDRGATGRIEVLGARIRVLQRLISWRKRAGIVCDMNGVPPIDNLEREIAEVRRQLRR
jgi:hypothetical protein